MKAVLNFLSQRNLVTIRRTNFEEDVEMSAKTFDKWFQLFLRYNDNGNVEQRFVTPDGHRLGYWVNSVRSGKYRLSEEQRERLDEAGFKWRSKSYHKREFSEWLEDFIKYNQDGYVSQKFVTPEGHYLGKWVSNMRANKYRMPWREKQLLNEAGFKWYGERVRTFEEWYWDFVKYSQAGYVPSNFVTPEGYRLGVWVSGVKRSLRKISNEERMLLTEAGFDWNIRAHRNFEDWLEDFAKYNEDGYIPLKFVTPSGYSLGMWVRNIRNGKYKLSEEQKRRLDDMGFRW